MNLWRSRSICLFVCLVGCGTEVVTQDLGGDPNPKEQVVERPTVRARPGELPELQLEPVVSQFEPARGCANGWVPLIETDEERLLEGVSFAAGPLGFAATWNLAGASYGEVAVFDIDGMETHRARVEVDTNVVAIGDQYLLFDPFSGTTVMEANGTMHRSEPSVRIHPRAVVGDRVYGLTVRNNELAYVHLENGYPTLENLYIVIEPGTQLAFGENLLAVIQPGAFQAPGSIELNELFEHGRPTFIRSDVLPYEDIAGLVSIGETVPAIAWNPHEQRFDLLVAFRMGATRDFTVRLMQLDQDGLSYGTPLALGDGYAGYEGVKGDIAINDEGAIAVAYGSPYTAASVQFEITDETGARAIEMPGAAYRTRPMIEAIEGGFAFMYGTGASSTSVWESQLRFRCDLQ